MLRSALGVLRRCPKYFPSRSVTVRNGICSLPQTRNFVTITSRNFLNESRPLLAHPKVQEISQNIGRRSVTKYSLQKGKRKSVKAVLKRFYRLNWGAWIRTKAGRKKKLWKKTPQQKRRLRQHVFCNAQQSTLLDKMVGSFWRKPKYYVDDPYNPYHVRDEYRTTYIKPRPYIPKEEQ